MSDKLLIVTMGLPYSGKSTWAQKQCYPIVNPDSIRMAMHGQRYVAEAEPLVWGIAKIMARALFLAGHQIVIVDATNTTRKRRDEWRDSLWLTNFKEFPVTQEECLARATAAGDDTILPIIEKMAGQWEPLHADEARC